MRLLSAILSAQGQRISVLVLHRVIFNSVFFTAEVSFNFKSFLTNRKETQSNLYLV